MDHSSSMPIPVAISSAEAEYNQACLACMATGIMHTSLNHTEGIQEGSREYFPVDILMDNKSAVDMSISFKDTKNVCHIHHRFHFVKQGVEQIWHKLIWIRNQFLVSEIATKTLCKKPLEYQTQWLMTKDVPE